MSKTTVYSQFNLRLPASVKYYQWHTEAAQQLTFSTEDISATREALACTSKGAITLSDVRKQEEDGLNIVNSEFWLSSQPQPLSEDSPSLSSLQ